MSRWEPCAARASAFGVSMREMCASYPPTARIYFEDSARIFYHKNTKNISKELKNIDNNRYLGSLFVF
jgi:hypothetical protein